MSCKDCAGAGALGYQIRISDARNLYNPSTAITGSRTLKRGGCGKIKCTNAFGSKCSQVCQMQPPCGDQFKAYAFKSCDVPLIKRYEEQPWFRNRLVQREWRGFVEQLVTPSNIGAKLCPGPDDWQFKCHKARSLVGPSVECVWDLPDQDPCAATSYGYNRDWRRYNEDQRMAATDMQCGCNDEPKCRPQKGSMDYPPYLGTRFGPRYMAWAHPTTFMYPNRKPYHYEAAARRCWVR